MKKETCIEITSRILSEMEKGIIPWQRPWTGTAQGPISHATGKAYSLLNQFLLAEPGEYITFLQAKQEGGHVRKGEKGKTIYLWKQAKVTEEKDGETIEKMVPVLKSYTVFHINQCEGIKPKYPPEERKQLEPIQEAETILENYINREHIDLNVSRLNNEAYYSLGKDSITIPALENYTQIEEYYSTAFHEMTHSTGHPSRLDRLKTGVAAAFGGQEYSKEELVAEIGAATLVNHCGIETSKSFRNSAAYIQSWMKALKNDPTMLVIAAGKADKAVQFILTGGAPCSKK